MSRILKSPYVTVDNDNKISIDVDSSDAFKSAQNPQVTEMVDASEEKYEHVKAICDQMIADAEAQAKQIEETARTVAEKLKADAQKKGEKDGYDKGYAKGVKEADRIKQEAESIRKRAVEEREDTLTSIEPEVVNLIINIIRKLLTDSMQINPDVIIYLIRSALLDTNMHGDVKIHVSESDYETVISKKDSFISLIDASAKTEIVKDFSLAKSDCKIETPFGDIDCSLTQQHNALERNLYYIFENR